MIMKSVKIRAAALCLAGAFVLGGCGAEPYELTEQERSAIVSYSAHIISKYNKLQTEGIKYVDMDEAVEEETEEPVESMDEPEGSESESSTEGTENQGGGEAAPEETVPEGDLNRLIAADGVTLSYQGCEVKKAYMEKDVYALEAPEGKAYLVLNFDITNESGAAAAVDSLSMSPTFHAVYTDESGAEKKAAPVQTLLSNDFSTFEKTLESGETQRVVLFFETEEDAEVFEGLQLLVEVNQNKFKINL